MNSRLNMLLILAALFIAPGAWAKDASGNLNLILSPSDGLPAFHTAGTEIQITVRQKASLELVDENDRATPLETIWKTIHPELFQGRCSIPGHLSPGLYSVRATTSDRTDTNTAALHVVVKEPETVTLTFAQSRSAIPAIQKTDSDLQIVVIPMSSDAIVPSQVQYPVIQIPNPGQEQIYQEKIGILPRAVTIGKYSLILFDVAETRAEHTGRLYQLRREHVANTWTIGITHRSPVLLPFQKQLTLFDDDPLHAVISPLPGDDADHLKPWSYTRFFAMPEVPARSMSILITPNTVTMNP